MLEESQAQKELFGIVPQPVASPSPELASLPSPVVLPEISLPAASCNMLLSQQTSHEDRPVMPLLSVRQPCPTCGQNVQET
jgi:hypothetical protein